MNIDRLTARRCLSGMAALALVATASAAPAQQILSVVESEPDDGSTDKVVVTTGGSLASTTQAGVDTRALTDFGVNKIYSASHGGAEQYATSAWLDSYTVDGAAGTMVDVTFNFSIDGTAAFSGDAEFNFAVYALRGNGWTMSGIDLSGGGGYFYHAPLAGGDNYERIILEKVSPTGQIFQMDTRNFDGFLNFNPHPTEPGEPGAFGSRIQYVENGGNSYYVYEYVNGPFGLVTAHIYDSYYTTVEGGIESGPQNYAINPMMNAVRTNLPPNYSMLDMAVMCGGDACGPGSYYPGVDLSLNFSLAAGSTFSLASVLFLDDLREGTIDLFNTAKVTGISVSNGAALTSESGSLTAPVNGVYGYEAAAALTPAVPEPGTWAMLIGGLAMVGGLMRRRKPAPAMA